MNGIRYADITERADVTDEVMVIVCDIVDGWYPSGRIDWQDLLDRVDGSPLNDGSRINLGESMVSPAIVEIKKRAKAYQAI